MLLTSSKVSREHVLIVVEVLLLELRVEFSLVPDQFGRLVEIGRFLLDLFEVVLFHLVLRFGLGFPV